MTSYSNAVTPRAFLFTKKTFMTVNMVYISAGD